MASMVKKKHITAMGTLSPALALSAVLVSHKRDLGSCKGYSVLTKHTETLYQRHEWMLDVTFACAWESSSCSSSFPFFDPAQLCAREIASMLASVVGNRVHLI